MFNLKTKNLIKRIYNEINKENESSISPIPLNMMKNFNEDTEKNIDKKQFSLKVLLGSNSKYRSTEKKVRKNLKFEEYNKKPDNKFPHSENCKISTNLEVEFSVSNFSNGLSSVFTQSTAPFNKSAIKSCKTQNLENMFINKPRDPLKEVFSLSDDNIDEQLLHPVVSISKCHVDNYRLGMILTYLKKPGMPKFKTDSCQQMTQLRKRTFNDFSNNSHTFQKPGNKFNLIYEENSLKIRKVSSCKKVYESVLNLYDKYNKSLPFKIYTDSDIGFDHRYDGCLRHMDFDNDVDTDDEQMYNAIDHTVSNMESTVKNLNTKLLSRKLIPKTKKKKN